MVHKLFAQGSRLTLNRVLGLDYLCITLVKMSNGNPFKRQRLNDTDPDEIRAKRSAFLSSLSRPVSPPNGNPKLQAPKHSDEVIIQDPKLPQEEQKLPENENTTIKIDEHSSEAAPRLRSGSSRTIVPSPFKLARSRGPPVKDNADTVTLHDILGDPLIKQAWIFNFCFDVHWTMKHFDADVRELVDVKIVHGSWRKEDRNRMEIQEHIQSWKNVQEIQAYMPDAFGTHHSKMIILFKHDETAQVVIHTANMLEKDWDHMTQAVWISPALPLSQDSQTAGQTPAVLGSGARFKLDLLRYVKAYGSKLKLLSEQLANYDFSEVKAALIASVPSYTKTSDLLENAWGHLALKNGLHHVNLQRSIPKLQSTAAHLVCQVSSIATLPATWLSDTIYSAATPSSGTAAGTTISKAPTTSIIYPTPTDLRDAITGYATGGSIHNKTATTAQQKQVSLLRPQLHRWGGQSPNTSNRAGRNFIPPHIKTYICYNSKPTTENPTPDIDWALLTSANLSTQAWGTAPKLPKGIRDPDQAVVHIQSFEIGVLVWPELFLESPSTSDAAGNQTARMIPTFRRDSPDIFDGGAADENSNEVLVGLRMPYDLPLTPYAPDEMPWSPQASYSERDSLGLTWG